MSLHRGRWTLLLVPITFVQQLLSGRGREWGLWPRQGVRMAATSTWVCAAPTMAPTLREAQRGLLGLWSGSLEQTPKRRGCCPGRPQIQPAYPPPQSAWPLCTHTPGLVGAVPGQERNPKGQQGPKELRAATIGSTWDLFSPRLPPHPVHVYSACKATATVVWSPPPH